MPWGAVIGAAGSLLGGAMSSSGASDAANAQAAASEQAAQIQQQEFQTVQGLNAPGRNLGYGADTLLAQLYGIPNPNSAATTAMYPANAALNGAAPAAAAPPGGVYGFAGTGNQPRPTGASMLTNGAIPGHAGAAPAAAAPAGGTPNFANFYNTPGYQFALNQGEQAINRGAAAGGNAYSTSTLAGLNNYAQGAASTQYNNYVQQLMGLAGLGGNAVAGTGSAALQTGNNISQAVQNAGAANASGILGSTGAMTGGINSAIGALSGSNGGGGAGGLFGQYFGGTNGGGTSNPYNSGAAWQAAGF